MAGGRRILCTVTETEPVKTSGPLAATSADGLRSEQEQLSRGPGAKALGQHTTMQRKMIKQRTETQSSNTRRKKKKVLYLIPT
jgi:hypothetical protein